MVKLVLELGGPTCPNCGTLVKGLSLIWVPTALVASFLKPVQCGGCRKWMVPEKLG
jgi:hypothetical protein